MGNLFDGVIKEEKIPGTFTRFQGELPPGIPTAEKQALEQPWVDPVSAFAGGFSGGLTFGLKAGAGILSSLGQATLSGVSGAIVDYPVGTATDMVAKNHPYLALPFNVLVGMVAGTALQNVIQGKVIAAFSRTKKIPIEKLTQSDFDQINKISSELEEIAAIKKPEKMEQVMEKRITELAQEATIPSVPVKSTAEHRATAPIQELAEEFRYPKQPWQRTAEDLLREQKDAGKLMGMPVGPEIQGVPSNIIKELNIIRQKYNYPIINNIDDFIKFAQKGKIAPFGNNEEEIKAIVNGNKLFGFYYKNEYKNLSKLIKEVGLSIKKEGDKIFVFKPENKNKMEEIVSNFPNNPMKLGESLGYSPDDITAFIYKFYKHAIPSSYKLPLEEPIKIKTPSIKPTSTPDEPARLVNPDGSEVIGGRLTPEAAETTRELARKYTASETDVDEIEKYVDSINIDRIDTTDDAKRFIVDTAKEIQNRVNVQRRGQIPHGETTRMAIRSGLTEKELLKAKPGKILNAEESLAASMINTASAKRTIEAAKKVAAGTANDEELFSFRLMLEKHQAIQAAESGLATEAGRALSARNIMRNAEQIKLKGFDTMIKALGGREVTEDIARRLAMIDPDNVQQVNRFIQTVNMATTTDKVFEVWVNSLLTSPITHIANSTSNTLTFLNKFPEKTVAAGFDALRSTFTGTSRHRYLGEVGSEVYGITEGLKTGIRNALWSFRTGLPADLQAKLEVRTFHAIKGKKGEIIRLPGRALTAADEFFKAINYSTELHGLAFRKAMEEGLTGKAKAKRIADIVANPMIEIDEKARTEMLYRTFQKPLSSFMGTLARARMSEGIGGTVFRFLVPFLRTPTNIAKYGLERTPIGFIYTASKQLGKSPFTPGEFSDRMARAAFGTVMGALVYTYALEGKITGGGPKDETKRNTLYRTGWQPYSIKIGTNYYSYKRLEPIGSITGMAADMAETGKEMSEQEWSDMINRMVTSFGKNITSKTFLRGISDALDAMSDPERYGPAWVNSFGGTVIPRGVAQLSKATDDYLRETDGLASYIQSEVPYLSHDLLPKRDIWGDPIGREGSFIMKFASPVQVSTEKGAKADAEILKLNVSIGKPSKKFSIPGGESVELNPKQYDLLLVQGGARAKKMIGDFVSTSGYERIPDDGKAKVLRNLYESAMNVERTRMIAELLKQRRQ